jgi:DNA polymerase-3 subunit delta
MQKLNEEIKSGQLKQVYLLYGEEAYLRSQYRDKLKIAMLGGGDAMNYHYFEGKDVSVGEIIDLAETMPFLSEHRVIVLENSNLFAKGGEQLADYLSAPAETTYFLFVEQSADKRSRLYKAVTAKGRAVEFKTQDEAVLKRWILGFLKKENKNITEKDLNLFLDKTGTDMENIRGELEKLLCYCMDKDVVSGQDIEEICTKQVSNQIFDMINAIAQKQQKTAMTLYYDLLTLKEPPMRILYLITRQFNMLLQVKELKNKGCDVNTIGERVGLAGFIARKYVAQAAKFKESELRQAVKDCVEAEEAVKTGRMNDIMSVELLIVQYSSEKPLKGAY